MALITPTRTTFVNAGSLNEIIYYFSSINDQDTFNFGIANVVSFYFQPTTNQVVSGSVSADYPLPGIYTFNLSVPSSAYLIIKTI